MKTFAGEYAFNFTSVYIDGDEKVGFNYQYTPDGKLQYTNKIFVHLRDVADKDIIPVIL